MLLKPVTIPVELLALKNTKLPEKLLLAMYAADPTTKWVLRAMNMTRAGWRKLEERLIQKKLLTVAGAHHMVQIPGLVYIGKQDEGHVVSDSSTTNIEKKIARRVSKTTQTDVAPLVVPAELLEFRYLMASEKVLLSYYMANPGTQNERVVETLGISRAGLKKLKRGLLRKQVLIPTDAGFTIRLPSYVLVRDSQGGHFISESEAVQRGYKVAHPALKFTPAQDIYDHWQSCLKQMCRQRSTTPSYCLSFTAKIIKRIEVESPEGPEREAVLAVMKEAENVFFAKDVLHDISKKCEAKCSEWLRGATPEQLVAFREKVEGMTLAGMPEPKQLGLVTEAIVQIARPERRKSPVSVAARRRRHVAGT